MPNEDITIISETKHKYFIFEIKLDKNIFKHNEDMKLLSLLGQIET